MHLFGKNFINRQKREGVCVAVSVVNALKWAGSKTATYKHVEYINKKIHGISSETKESKVREVLNKCLKYFSFVYKKYPSLKEIKNHLKTENSAIILSYFCSLENGDEVGHAVLVFEKDGKVYVLNERKKNIVFTWEEFRERFMKKTQHYPSVYKLNKNEVKNG